MAISEAIKTFSEPVNKLLVPLTSSAGRTLQDVWELVFGGFGNYVEKKRMVRLKALEDFKTSLENKVAAIPPEQLCEPSLSVVGPALDASKYSFEEPEIREMFAKLIASSMDRQRAPSIHPSFSEIIRQMSPLDAQNLTYFTKGLPVVKYRKKHKTGDGFTVLFSNVFLANPSEQDLEKQSVSLASLSRLGLINISYEQWLNDESFYTAFERTALYQSLQAHLSGLENVHLDVIKGLADPTPLGTQFIKVCLN